ncbi:GNAT family N-acetyltransferase [Streptacidiphilus monticola]|jgi:ribosomal protein S18 acetylase RimI-like enzyme|uniref:GNAT family N-acetyltransferase n=1 Tax=Streptacidiphilus monticola TaxID=2161674 RepID=A0ABW1G654_9ACTN
MHYRIHRIQPGDWELLRDIRLRMLKDTPVAFGERYDDALNRTVQEWERRAARNTAPGNTGYAAVHVPTGQWVGHMRADLDVDDPTLAWLMGVWVQPEHRGRAAGVTDLLLDACVAWATEQPGMRAMLLEVHESNARAIAAYARRGFVPTGRRSPYALLPGTDEIEMRLPLSA